MLPLKGTYYQSWILDEFLSDEQPQLYVDAIDFIYRSIHPNQLIRDKVRDHLWILLHPILKPVMDLERDGKMYHLQKLSYPIGLYKRSFPAEIHRDPHNGPGILLQGIIMIKDGGGLTFYDEDQDSILAIPMKSGKLILFDIREYHSGMAFPRSSPEYSLEFRLHYEEVGKSQ